MAEENKCRLQPTMVQRRAVEELGLMQGRAVLEDMTKNPRHEHEGFSSRYKSMIECLLMHSIVRVTDLPGASRHISFRTNVASLPSEVLMKILLLPLLLPLQLPFLLMLHLGASVHVMELRRRSDRMERRANQCVLLQVLLWHIVYHRTGSIPPYGSGHQLL